ncbi:MAG: ArsR family transcriptional regulator, partial [Bacteroidetes bacterium]|nr:ArsR family transcriptional regulator [Bacteroidota bacterium]
MLDTLITSKTRIKLMLKFFLNSSSSSYLRGLESEFGESSNAIRLELNRFEQAGLLASFLKSNRKYFKANTKHPLFRDIHSLLRKYVGIDEIIDSVIEKMGDVKEVYLTGDFA